jgi:hypothetical protein
MDINNNAVWGKFERRVSLLRGQPVEQRAKNNKHAAGVDERA